MGSTMTAESRLLSLLGMLATGRTRTATELAAHFGVTPRSIRRDMTSLRQLGYVIESVPGVLGGYRAQSHTVLPPLQLETGEALATAVGLALLNGAGLGTSNADSATAKLQGMLPPAMRETIRNISTAVSVLPGHEPGVDMTAVMTTASAIASRSVLTFTHVKRKSAGSQAMERRVEPVRMVVLGAHWYLYAWDLTRADWRVFRLDRMSEVHETTFAFAPRDHPDAEAAVSSAVTTHAYRHTVILDVDASAAEAEAWFPTRAATITATDDGARVEFGVEDLTWAAVITAATPVSFRVIEPPALLDALHDLGARAARVSRSGTSRSG
ncbi:helix-turn-helix transcriptional regulator [Brevibacterium marinum]|uniref:Putative DNA-binding transcriptional regulator YafY n=1 Tax=Brevibacterium marinum TaxID=418643 RepID=A0A846RT19_9MICO|nr:YafY family protein [Brevibacterium marinum]NJC55116.1 putative DNA-binding transcriptional regulator YafY [Brevibacterium marinum]